MLRPGFDSWLPSLGFRPPLIRTYVCMRTRGPKYSEQAARDAVAASLSYAETLRRLGMCPSGGAHVVLKKWCVTWQISTEHFDRHAAARRRGDGGSRLPLEQILVAGSGYHRGHLNRRLFEEGVKVRACELCGQGERWRGQRMSLILDHINGIRDDHRLENLRIVCPNCAATLETHCGRKTTLESKRCLRCDKVFEPRSSRQRYCSSACGSRHDRSHLRGPRPTAWKVQRPAYRQLMDDLASMSYLAVGRKYGVSDNTVRKWVKSFHQEWDMAV